jgi:hypothetical protein
MKREAGASRYSIEQHASIERGNSGAAPATVIELRRIKLPLRLRVGRRFARPDRHS